MMAKRDEASAWRFFGLDSSAHAVRWQKDSNVIGRRFHQRLSLRRRERRGARRRWAVQVIIHMPVQQNIITSVAGFMTCVAELYGLEFDGWGCIAQTASA